MTEPSGRKRLIGAREMEKICRDGDSSNKVTYTLVVVGVLSLDLLEKKKSGLIS